MPTKQRSRTNLTRSIRSSKTPLKGTQKQPRTTASAETTTTNGQQSRLADHACSVIGELIISGALSPKTLVSEISLSKQLDIGRTPIREALKRLEADGLITILPSRGVLITEVDVKHQLLLIEVRRELERLIATRAARLATPMERDQMIVVASEMERAAQLEDEPSFARADRQLDILLDSGARSFVASQTVRPLRSLSRRFWFQNYRSQPGSLTVSSQVHAKVAQAVAAGDVQVAAKASDAQMDYIESFARATIGAAL
jgi:DNA-binding GntR family transcriptional regulator